jgi:hypothetical protein
VESFNARLRDELLNGEVFHAAAEARVLITRWTRHYNAACPQFSLGYRPPAPDVMPFAQPSWAAGPMPQQKLSLSPSNVVRACHAQAY